MFLLLFVFYHLEVFAATSGSIKRMPNFCVLRCFRTVSVFEVKRAHVKHEEPGAELDVEPASTRSQLGH